jgi:hypothetical protein
MEAIAEEVLPYFRERAPQRLQEKVAEPAK